MNTSRWITLSDAIFCCCDQRVGSSHPCHPWTQRLGYLDGFRIPRNKQNIPSGKLTQTLKITNFQLKLICQPLFARVYVNLLEGISCLEDFGSNCGKFGEMMHGLLLLDMSHGNLPIQSPASLVSFLAHPHVRCVSVKTSGCPQFHGYPLDKLTQTLKIAQF